MEKTTSKDGDALKSTIVGMTAAIGIIAGHQAGLLDWLFERGSETNVSVAQLAQAPAMAPLAGIESQNAVQAPIVVKMMQAPTPTEPLQMTPTAQPLQTQAAPLAPLTAQLVEIAPLDEDDHSGHDHSAFGEHANDGYEAPLITLAAQVIEPDDHAGHDHASKAVATADTLLASLTPAVEIAPCVAELQTIAARSRIYFNSNSASMSGQAKETAFLIASLMQSCPEATVEITGFADPLGDSDANIALSWSRANATFQTMTQAGFDVSGLSVSSHIDGEHPAHCVHYDVVDRRVEFVVSQDG